MPEVSIVRLTVKRCKSGLRTVRVRICESTQRRAIIEMNIGSHMLSPYIFHSAVVSPRYTLISSRVYAHSGVALFLSTEGQ